MSGEGSGYMDELCKRRTTITIIFIIALLFLLVQLPYLVVVETGSALYTISVINVVGLVVFTGASGWVLWTCRDRFV